MSAVFIGVYAYGESRFELTFDPCSANIASLCPMNSSVPIEANGIIPVAQSDVAGIPSIALTIPDFEGQAILRVFANSTQSQIGCVSAVITNGATFSHPGPVGGTLGAFTIIALVASVATAVYGQSVTETRNHYAHSVSVLAVFAVFHHIFFTGGLSMNWPSVLVAFWSNYAWAGGMIYSKSMQNTINNFIGSNKGNISTVGSAPSGQNAPNLGGGYSISQIYKRDLANSSTGFQWYGKTCTAWIASSWQLFWLRWHACRDEHTSLQRVHDRISVVSRTDPSYGSVCCALQVVSRRAQPLPSRQDAKVGVFQKSLDSLHCRRRAEDMLYCILHDGVLDYVSIHAWRICWCTRSRRSSPCRIPAWPLRSRSVRALL